MHYCPTPQESDGRESLGVEQRPTHEDDASLSLSSFVAARDSIVPNSDRPKKSKRVRKQVVRPDQLSLWNAENANPRDKALFLDSYDA